MTDENEPPSRTYPLYQAITTRHSSRDYLPTPVPPPQLRRALALAAQHSPSNSNVQPWRLWVLSGGALRALTAALAARAGSDEVPQIPALPPWAVPFRSHLGRTIYGEGWGIAREDHAAHRAAVLRNFEFFGAPVGAVVCMRDDLSSADSLSVGMYLQTLVLALRAEGIDSCVEVSIGGYPEAVRKAVGIPEDMIVICGIAIGFEDPASKVNTLSPERLGLEETTVLMSD
ncbi:hypothetical protein Daus18300_008836 [Diaporthe australafricana]|uniref:Nitroreductase domain-containing protein n=1 Tax=Diaporthe australafricana TaxID=127596 RepID=A0ABR3WGP6_9PEZI